MFPDLRFLILIDMLLDILLLDKHCLFKNLLQQKTVMVESFILVFQAEFSSIQSNDMCPFLFTATKYCVCTPHKGAYIPASSMHLSSEPLECFLSVCKA